MTKEKIISEIKSWTMIILIAFIIKSSIFAAYFVPTGSMENTILTGDFLIGNNMSYNIHTPDRIGIPFTKIGLDIPRLQMRGFKKLQQGDIVIFRYPKDHSLNYVKRCVALPGQYLQIINKQIIVDDKIFSNAAETKFTRENSYGNHLVNRGIFPKNNGNEDNYSEIYVPQKGDTLYFNDHNFELIKNVAWLSGDSISKKDAQQYYVTKQHYYFMMGDNRDESYDSRFWGFVPESLIVGEPLILLSSFDLDQPGWNIFNRIRWRRIGKLF